jgi:hypothetical protein
MSVACPCSVYLYFYLQLKTESKSSGKHAFRKENAVFIHISVKFIIVVVISYNNAAALVASKLYRPSNSRMSTKLVPTFAGRKCRVGVGVV